MGKFAQRLAQLRGRYATVKHLFIHILFEHSASPALQFPENLVRVRAAGRLAEDVLYGSGAVVPERDSGSQMIRLNTSLVFKCSIYH